jgi:predicted DNA-binding protein YlxM (UPF0122 family)
MLTPEQQSEILARYYNEKQSVRSIARLLGVSRDSVSRVIHRRSVNLILQQRVDQTESSPARFRM